MHTGPRTASAAARCSGSSPASTALACLLTRSPSMVARAVVARAVVARAVVARAVVARTLVARSPDPASGVRHAGEWCPPERGCPPRDNVCGEFHADDVYDHLVWLLLAPQGAIAARRHRLRRGEHRGGRGCGRARHERQRRHPNRPDGGVPRWQRPHEPEHRRGQGSARRRMTRGGFVPLAPDALPRGLAERIATLPATLRVAIDGPPCARPHTLAHSLAEPLRALGRPVVHIRAESFWRDASLRF